MKHLSLLSLLALLFLVPACGGDDDGTDPGPTCDTENITYTNFVGDVLNENCTFSVCHFSGNPAIGGLTTYEEASNFGFEANMIDALRRADGVQGMPRDTTTGMASATPLPDCTIDKIEAWLDAGKPE